MYAIGASGSNGEANGAAVIGALATGASNATRNSAAAMAAMIANGCLMRLLIVALRLQLHAR
jgi:ABC-type Fe3+ transport system substrate-binding protein